MVDWSTMNVPLWTTRCSCLRLLWSSKMIHRWMIARPQCLSHRASLMLPAQPRQDECAACLFVKSDKICRCSSGSKRTEWAVVSVVVVALLAGESLRVSKKVTFIDMMKEFRKTTTRTFMLVVRKEKYGMREKSERKKKRRSNQQKNTKAMHRVLVRVCHCEKRGSFV